MREKTYTKRGIQREDGHKKYIYIEKKQRRKGYKYGVETNQKKTHMGNNNK